MGKQSVNELGRMLPDRIRLLSCLIARKPTSFTSEWASSIDQAFSLYTRTSTVDLFNSLNQCLIELDWPFPAYLDLRDEFQKSVKGLDFVRRPWLAIPVFLRRRQSFSRIVLLAAITQAKDALRGQQVCDAGMVSLFERHSYKVFRSLAAAKVLQPKQPMLKDIEQAYQRKMWVACITTTFPLLDFVMRSFFETEKLNVTIQVLCDAYIRVAKLRPQDLMPGYSVWDGQRDPEKGNVFAKAVEEDLRLPGVYLSSFFEFANRYYEWYKSTEASPRTPLNRHAIMHCSSEDWTQANAVRILTFLDLTVRLEPALKILIRGKDALRGLHKQGD